MAQFNFSELAAQAQAASLLVNLGLSTWEKIRKVWADNGVDSATLDRILLEAETRIAQRKAEIEANK